MHISHELTNTEESDELEIHSMLVKKYEDEYYPISKPSLKKLLNSGWEQMNVADA